MGDGRQEVDDAEVDNCFVENESYVSSRYNGVFLHTIGGHDHPWMAPFNTWIQGLPRDDRKFDRRRHTSRRDFSTNGGPHLWMAPPSIDGGDLHGFLQWSWWTIYHCYSTTYSILQTLCRLPSPSCITSLSLPIIIASIISLAMPRCSNSPGCYQGSTCASDNEAGALLQDMRAAVAAVESDILEYRQKMRLTNSGWSSDPSYVQKKGWRSRKT